MPQPARWTKTDETPAYRIGEIAAMAGLSTHTIRDWERRYQVVSPHRTASNQRRYTIDDLEHLVRFKQSLTGLGLSRRLASLQEQGRPLAETLLQVPQSGPHPEYDYEPDAWRSAADLMPELMFVLDGSGVVVDANIAVARGIGTVRDRLRGLRFADLVDPHDRAKAEKIHRPPVVERRDWALNLSVGRLAGLYSFESRPAALGATCLVVAVGWAAGSS
ncbi:MAG: MerR family transcriptional regulator [Candidatus Dormibacteraeota bacterium]|nr:MerR family transcriptional regulator [Candidatus Dormibacteraeota bacterium]